MDNKDFVKTLKNIYDSNLDIMIKVDAGIVDPRSLNHPIELTKRETALIQELLYLQEIKEAQVKFKEDKKDVKACNTSE